MLAPDDLGAFRKDVDGHPFRPSPDRQLQGQSTEPDGEIGVRLAGQAASLILTTVVLWGASDGKLRPSLYTGPADSWSALSTPVDDSGTSLQPTNS